MGMLGSDDVLACFIAGNVFTWDDWFRLETADDSLQPTIDMLLNVAIFMWFGNRVPSTAFCPLLTVSGAVCPWHKFVDNSVIPIYRLIPLGILVLLLRRLPMMFAFHKAIHQVEHWQHAAFVGFFGPIGVSAIFYLYIAREFLRTVVFGGHERADAAKEYELLEVVVWFLVVCSIVVHGLSIPLGKLGLYLPRTISTAVSSERALSRPPSQAPSRTTDNDEPVMPHWVDREERTLARSFRRRRPTTTEVGPSDSHLGYGSFLGAVTGVFKNVARHTKRPKGSTVHGSAQNKTGDSDESPEGGRGTHPEISGPRDGRILGNPINSPPQVRLTGEDTPPRPGAISPPDRSRAQTPAPSGSATPTGGWQRSIRFEGERREKGLESATKSEEQ